jgi:Zn-dependent protease with chaperone function
MNKHSHWLAGVAIFVGLVNFLLAFIFFRLIEVKADMPPTERGYTIEALALQITILEMVIGLFLAGLGIVGFFGYLGIKNAAIKKAEEAADRVAAEKMEQFINQQAVANMGSHSGMGANPAYIQQPDTSPKPPSGSQRAGDSE